MRNYYRMRAHEYEDIYSRLDPIQQKEQQSLLKALRSTVSNRDILDIASGTGYWTSLISDSSTTIVGLDFTDAVLSQAQTKTYHCPTSFCLSDAFHLPFQTKCFNGAIALFWLSHIPEDQISVFLRRLHSTLKMKSVVFIADNVYVADRGGKLIQDYLRSNTYKIRKLKNMTRHVILKNYFQKADLLRIFSKFDSNFNEENISFGERYWHLHYYLDKI